jgi:hypothetical protein
VIIRFFLILLFALLNLSAVENEQKVLEIIIEREECNDNLFKDSGLEKPIKIHDSQKNLDSYYAACKMVKSGKPEQAKKLLLELKSDVYNTIDANLSNFLNSWRESWESRKFERYVSYYDKSFINDTLWFSRKQIIFADAALISLSIIDPIYKKIDESNYIVKFYQKYTTNKRCDKGYKTLHLSCNETKTECKITQESWDFAIYEKSLFLMPYIDKSIEEIDSLQKSPLALDSSKKKKLCLNLQRMRILT